MSNELNLKSGQVFKNFKELCQYLSWGDSSKSLTGYTKIKYENELKRYCNYEKVKNSNSIKILEIYDTPFPKNDGRSSNTEYSNFIMLIFYMLQEIDEVKLEKLTTLVSKTKLFKELDICNRAFDFNSYPEDAFYVGYVFTRESSKNIKGIISSSIDNLSKRNLIINKSETLMVTYKDKKSKIADENEKEIYINTKKELDTIIESYIPWGANPKKLSYKEEKERKKEVENKRKELYEPHNICYFHTAISFELNDDVNVKKLFYDIFFDNHKDEIQKGFGTNLITIDDFLKFDNEEIIDFCKAVLHYKYLNKCRTSIKSQLKYYHNQEKNFYLADELEKIDKLFEEFMRKLKNTTIPEYDKEFYTIYDNFQYYHLSDNELIAKLKDEKTKSINSVEHNLKANCQNNENDTPTSKIDPIEYPYPRGGLYEIKIKLTKDDIKDDVEFFESADIDEFLRNNMHYYMRCNRVTDEVIKSVKASIQKFQNFYLSLFAENDEIDNNMYVTLKTKADPEDIRIINRSLKKGKPTKEEINNYFINNNFENVDLKRYAPCYLVFDIWEKKIDLDTIHPVPKEIEKFLVKCRNDFFALTKSAYFCLGIENVDPMLVCSGYFKSFGVEKMEENLLRKIYSDPTIVKLVKDFAVYHSYKLKELIQKYEGYLHPKYKEALLNYEFYLILNNEKIVFNN